MAHRYGRPVHVSVRGHSKSKPECEGGRDGGTPVSFRWLGAEYPIREVLATWHLRDRWWAAAPTTHVPRQSDRFYYRVRCRDEQVFDLYYDVVSRLWVLDVAHD